tara:strand:+ start:1133 stop:1330 length:198 start_codon:yes stop_codon:yes gene_type:complete
VSLLLMLKEGGSLGIDTIGNKPIDEDIDLLETSAGISLALRLNYNALSVTSVTATTVRAIVLGDS